MPVDLESVGRVLKTAYTIPVARALFGESQAFRDVIRRMTHPWEFPDRPNVPRNYILFPKIERFGRFTVSVRALWRDRKDRTYRAWRALAGDEYLD